MELDAVQRKGTDAGNIFQQRLPCFAWQAQDEVSADGDAAGGGFPYSPFCAGESVPPMYPQQGFIPARLDSVFHSGAPERGDVIQLFRIHAVRPGTDDDAGNGWMRQSFRVGFPESLKRCMRIGKRLEIGEIRSLCLSPCRMKSNSFVDLLRDAFLRRTVSRMERGVVTERTPAVRARESRVHDQLLSGLFRGMISFSLPLHRTKIRKSYLCIVIVKQI